MNPESRDRSVLIAGFGLDNSNDIGFINAFKKYGWETTEFDISGSFIEPALKSGLPLAPEIARRWILRRFKSQLRSENPDVLFLIKGHRFINKYLARIARECGVTSAWFTPDDPAQFLFLSQQTSVYFDHVFTASERFIHLYAEMGVESVTLLPFAIRRDYHRPVANLSEKYKVTALHVGQWYPERERYLSALDPDIDLCIIGPGWDAASEELQEAWIGEGIYDEELLKWFSGADIVLNIPHVMDMISKPNSTLTVALGTGAFVITRDTAELDKLFKHEEHLIAVNSPEEMSTAVNTYSTEDSIRRKVSSTAREYTLNNHTYLDRVEEISNVIDLD